MACQELRFLSSSRHAVCFIYRFYELLINAERFYILRTRAKDRISVSMESNGGVCCGVGRNNGREFDKYEHQNKQYGNNMNTIEDKKSNRVYSNKLKHLVN